MRTYRSRLKADLHTWVRIGLISPEQEKKLHEWLASQSAGSRLKGVAWLAILAGIFVAAGVSLIIAHNWEEIPSVIKICVYIGLLFGVGEIAIRNRPKKPIVSNVAEVFWFFCPIVGIGLFAQIFQLSGDPIRPYFVWLALVAPLAIWSQNPFAAPAHVLLLLYTLLKANFWSPNSLSLVRHSHWQHVTAANPSAWVWVVSICILMLAAFESRYRLKPGHRTHVAGAILLWLNFLFFFPTPLRVDAFAYAMASAFASSILWFIFSLRIGSSPLERRLPRLAVLASVYALTFLSHLTYPRGHQSGAVGLTLLTLLCAAAVIGTVTIPKGLISPNDRWQKGAQAFLLLGLGIAFLAVADQKEIYQVGAIFANVLMLAAGVGLMWHGAIFSSVSQINIGILVVVVLLITRFIDVFGSFLKSGFGFIVAGLLLAGLAFGLKKGRATLIEHAQTKEPL